MSEKLNLCVRDQAPGRDLAHVCVCECVHERERERETERKMRGCNDQIICHLSLPKSDDAFTISFSNEATGAFYR